MSGFFTDLHQTSALQPYSVALSSRASSIIKSWAFQESWGTKGLASSVFPCRHLDPAVFAASPTQFSCHTMILTFLICCSHLLLLLLLWYIFSSLILLLSFYQVFGGSRDEHLCLFNQEPSYVILRIYRNPGPIAKGSHSGAWGGIWAFLRFKGSQ